MKRKALKCDRCGGMMSFEQMINTSQEGPEWSFKAWRCLFCGEVIDPLILANRFQLAGYGPPARKADREHRPQPVGVG